MNTEGYRKIIELMLLENEKTSQYIIYLSKKNNALKKLHLTLSDMIKEELSKKGDFEYFTKLVSLDSLLTFENYKVQKTVIDHKNKKIEGFVKMKQLNK